MSHFGLSTPRGSTTSSECVSCGRSYARSCDTSATRDVGRMSFPPAHTGAMRVLVVEDHTTLANRIVQGLRQAGMVVDAAYDGTAALEATAQTAYDVMVLDRDLPAVHGDQVSRTAAGSAPRILMLAAAAATRSSSSSTTMDCCGVTESTASPASAR
jgi:CheY-like chemotaxis protein